MSLFLCSLYSGAYIKLNRKMCCFCLHGNRLRLQCWFCPILPDIIPCDIYLSNIWFDGELFLLVEMLIWNDCKNVQHVDFSYAEHCAANLYCSTNYLWWLEVFLFVVSLKRSDNVMQTGQETDFVLVSCTGLGVEPARREQVLKAKRVSTEFCFCSFLLLLVTSCKYLSSLVQSVGETFPGWGRLTEEIRPWIHNHSPWSPKGNYCPYPKLAGFINLTFSSYSIRKIGEKKKSCSAWETAIKC